MAKIILILILTAYQFSFADYYKLNTSQEVSVILPAATVLGISMYQDKRMNPADSELIEMLNAEDINQFDKAAVSKWSPDIAVASDYLLGASLAAPFLLTFDSKSRDNFGKFITIYSEVFLINNALTNIIKVNTKRIRPYAYNNEVPTEYKLNKDIRKSFISGHTSNSFAMMTLTAKMFSDLYPDSKYKSYVWAGAMSIATASGLFRYFAGKHFPTDIIAGALVGFATGYIIPEIHKNESTDINNNSNYILSFSYSF